MLIVQVCDFGDDGDARYRVHDPSIALGQLPGVAVIDCHFFSRQLPELIEKADVLILQFVLDWEMTGIVLRRRATGKITVFEANDFFFDLQPWNPIAPPWQDRTVQELYLQLLSLCDGVQTSTDYLAGRWREMGARNVAVFPNQLTSIPDLAPPVDRRFTVGWAGSPAHLADLYNLAPPLQRWLNAHPDVHLAIMTTDLARPFFDLPAERYHFSSFASLDAYKTFLRRIDVGFAPLLPTDYNRGRSDVKFLEYASQGVVGVYSHLDPYRAIQHGQTGFLATTPDDMITQLEQLRADPALRLRVRSQAHQHIQNRLLPHHIQTRLDWYRTLTGPVPPRSQGYAAVVPAEPESTLRNALALPPAQGSANLSKLLEQHPTYLTALQHQGKLLNDIRRSQDALAVLQKAKDLEPHSAPTLNEMGRSHYWLNDNPKAVACVNEALAINPHYLPAWQYLLRVLAISKDPSLSQRASEASALFPDCYPLSILGVTTAEQLLDVLNRFAPMLNEKTRAPALALFRPAILALPSLPLLRKAVDLFPESIALTATLAETLEKSCHPAESQAWYAKALALRTQAETATAELGKATLPLKWQLADHIRRASEQP